MTIPRDPDAILAAWLDEGPSRLPDATRRAIAVSTRTTRQSRLPVWMPWRSPRMNGMTRLALGAVAVVAVVVGGLYLLKPATGGVGGPGTPVPSASPFPSTSASPSTATLPDTPVGALTQAFTSPTFGYSLRYPAGWTVIPTTGEGPTAGGADEFNSAGGGWSFRGLSRAIPDGAVVDDWIVGTLQDSNDPACMPRRDTMESVAIDGHEGRLMGFCGTPTSPQIEATVAIDKTAYLFTLFDTRDAASGTEARALFDRLMATITFDPASAGGSPAPSPS